jgi:hypothetical protein
LERENGFWKERSDNPAIYAPIFLAPIIPGKDNTMLNAAYNILEACGFAGLSNGRI